MNSKLSFDGIPLVTEIKKRRGAYLPHWTREGGWYAVTFRLWDSLPQNVLEVWLFERKNIVKTAEQMKRPLSEQEERRLVRLYSEKVERYLDAGYGACFMKDPRVAKLIVLGRRGDFWQLESYDHLIRNEADFRHAVRYVLNNPKIAGLKNWKWVGLTERGKRILSVRYLWHAHLAREINTGGTPLIVARASCA